MALALILFALGIWMAWNVASKAGYSGASSLLMIIPIVNVIVPIVFAFSEWPIEKELRELRELNASRSTD